jgi:drug/metabolite transporter (DMT)-like permease
VQWLLVGLIVLATVCADLLQAHEMRRGPRWPYLAAAVFFMAVSFFSFAALLKMADISFAVPATAASLVAETLLAGVILRERVDARRWAGALLVACGVALVGQ